MEFFKFYYRRKLQVTLQGEHSECGLAVVNMILNFNDYNTKLMDLRSEYGVPRGGLTLKNMYTILQDYGFKNRALKVSGEEAIAKIPTPAIAFWEQNHYVVIVEVRRTKVLIADPSSGKMWMPIDDFMAKFSNVILYSEKIGDKKNIKSVNDEHYIIKLLKSNFKNDVLWLFIYTFLLQLLLLTLPIGMKYVVDGISSGVTFNPLVLVSLTVMIAASLYFVFEQRSVVMARFQRNFDHEIMSDFVGNLLNMPIEYFETRSTGELVFRSNLNVYIRQLISQRAISIFVDAFFLVIYVIVMVIYSIKLSFITFGFSGIIVAVMIYNSQSVKKYVEQETRIQGEVQKIVSESIKGIETIKSLDKTTQFFENWHEAFEKQLDTTFKKDLFLAKNGNIPDIIQNVLPLVLVISSVFFLKNDNITIGTVVAFLSLVGLFLKPLVGLTSLYNDFLVLKVYLDKLSEILNTRMVEGHSVEGVEEALQIKIDDVSFSKSVFEKDILSGINLTINAGDKIAVVGKSGSGKSTLLKVIKGMIKPTQGDVSYLHSGGIVRNPKILLINQQTDVFNVSVKKNVVLDFHKKSEPLDIDRLESVLESSDMMSTLQYMPSRWETIVSENGKNFSGGQRQKMAMGRVFYSTNGTVLLDEPTSAMDNLSERKVLKGLLEEDKTVVMVAHRLRTVMNFNRIIVLDQGRIVGDGTHKTLIKDNAIYKSLYEAEDQG